MKTPFVKRRGMLALVALALCAAGSPVRTQAQLPVQAVQDLASLAHAAEAFVRRALPADAKGVAIQALGIDPRLRLARCEAPLTTDWAAGGALAARTSVVVACTSGVPWRMHVPVRVSSHVEVLVLKAPAARGASLSQGDVTTRRIEVEGLAVSYVRSVEELAGRHLKRTAPAGVPLPASWFEADKLMRRGQTVTLVASAAGIRVRAPGRALADGAVSERIRVQNLSSLKIVEGVVESGSEVRVGR